MRTRARAFTALVTASLLALLAGALPSTAVAAEQPAAGLDGQCYTLRVTTTGTVAGANNYIEKTTVGYGTRGTAADAEPIVLAATAPGRYRMHDTTGALLYLSVSGHVWAGSSYGDRADWTISVGSAGHRIRSTATGQLIGSVSGQFRTSDASFQLVPASGCAPLADATTGEVSAATEPTVTADGQLNGFIDAHAHPASSAAFGGEFLCGEPFAPGGIADALAGCPSHAVGAGTLFEAIIGGTDPLGGDDGWPTFTDWPTPTSLLHQQAYYTGIERAWRSGMRVFNALLVGNRLICEIYPTRTTSCDEMEQVRAQATLLHDLEDYIDARSGGPGRGWFRIAATPEDVRQIAAEGKLAVTLGVEVSELFGCRSIDDVAQCDQADIDAGLDEMAALGVSGLFPVHKFDNAFGGTRFDPGTTGAALNLGNLLSTGHWWTAESCTGPSDNAQTLTNDGLADLLATVSGAPAGTVLPVYPTGDVCNTRGLTPLGEYLIEQMMARGMIVNIDHMGVRTAQAVLDLTEEAGYRGITSAHTWSDREILARIAQGGGFVAGYALSASDASADQIGFLTEWSLNREAAGPGALTSYGYGSDVNGLGPQPPARVDAAEHPLVYPFTAPNGAVFDRQVFGERTWDLNSDGVAQYGLYADWVADVLQVAGAEAADREAELMRGAESYVEMWEDARGWQS